MKHDELLFFSVFHAKCMIDKEWVGELEPAYTHTHTHSRVDGMDILWNLFALRVWITEII